MRTGRDIEKAIRREPLPEWVQDVRVRDMVDADGEPALDVCIVIRSNRLETFTQGEGLREAVRAVHRAVRQAGVEVWPYTRFVDADELEAA